MKMVAVVLHDDGKECCITYVCWYKFLFNEPQNILQLLCDLQPDRNPPVEYVFDENWL